MVTQAPSNQSVANSAEILAHIQHYLREKGGLDILTIDLQQKSSVADYLIIATGTSNTHINTLADQVERACDETGMPVLSVEGKSSGDWVIVDTPDIIVHLFRPAVRELFDLESMWSDQAPSAAYSAEVEHIS